MKFTIYTADCTGNERNAVYPNKATISNGEELKLPQPGKFSFFGCDCHGLRQQPFRKSCGLGDRGTASCHGAGYGCGHRAFAEQYEI